MSRPKFLADHDLNEHIVDGVLRWQPLIEFTRLREVGLDGRPDREVLDYAAANQLIVVSHDVNTMPVHARARIAASQFMGGLLLVPQTSAVAPIIDDLILIWSASAAEEWQNQVFFLPL